MALLALAGCGAERTAAPELPAQAPQARPAEWYQMRADIASRICVRTAPDFAGFAEAVAAAGMNRSEAGLYNDDRSEIVASLAEGDGGCSCRVSYQAPQPDSAVEALRARLAADLGTRLVPEGSDARRFIVTTGTAAAPLRILDYPHDGLTWLALVVHGPKSCPEGLAAEGT
ncbi:MAG: hypothetical protein D6754_12545 [Alphaproteobacteria bacterium]|nr:MAG: hypothetical protein D6754_12545 [Alphaproteobacteria bacterium]